MSDYNKMPEGLKEISLEEWAKGMFCYCILPVESRQVTDVTFCNLRMFDVPNHQDKKLGFAIMDDWYDKETGKNRHPHMIRFCRYGLDDDWRVFEQRFAAQFARDNS